MAHRNPHWSSGEGARHRPGTVDDSLRRLRLDHLEGEELREAILARAREGRLLGFDLERFIEAGLLAADWRSE